MKNPKKKGIKGAPNSTPFRGSPSSSSPTSFFPLQGPLNNSSNMQSFTSLSLLLTLALSAFASPIEKRATISCESTPFVSNQHITANTVDNIVFGLGNTTATDHLGNKAKVVISTKDDGSSEFYPASSNRRSERLTNTFSFPLSHPLNC